MKKNSLSKNGLSLSQAQSISNLCNQRCRDISNILGNVNNVSKVLTIAGEVYIETQPNPLPTDTIDLLKEKSRLHAAQAFIMENIKAKDSMLINKQCERFDYSTIVESPKREPMFTVVEDDLVGEDWGWNQLSIDEYNKYLEAEAYAAHIGQFIHKGGSLDNLRQELPTIKTLEWIVVEDGKKTPLKVSIHHSADQLADLHEELATIHRGYEQRVNYFKAKVKNAVTIENARISKENADAQSKVKEANQIILDKHNKACEEWFASERKAAQEFEVERQKEIARIAALKIDVPSRFQPVIDMFLKKLE